MKTLGNRVIKFIEMYCVHSSGDYLGEPFKLKRLAERNHQRAL